MNQNRSINSYLNFPEMYSYQNSGGRRMEKHEDQSRIYFSKGTRCNNAYHSHPTPYRRDPKEEHFKDKTVNITIRSKTLPFTVEFPSENNIALKIHIRYTNGHQELEKLFVRMHGELGDDEKKRKRRKTLTRATFPNCFNKKRKSPVAVFFTWGQNQPRVEDQTTERVCKKITKLMLHHPKFVNKSPVFFARCTTCRKIHHIRDI